MKENIKKIFSNKMYRRFAIVFGVMILAVIIILIVASIANRTISFEQAENKMKDAAISYYKSNEDLLPNVNESTTVELSTLVDGEYIYDLSTKLEDKTSACAGTVKVYNNNGNYLYTANLSCGDTYNSSTIYNKVLEDNQVTAVNNGLYEYNGYYIFKGESVNNYVEFNDSIWRIVKVNNTYVRLIETETKLTSSWDDRYNSERQSDVGINNYETSRLKETLDSSYETFNSENKKYLLKQNVCIGKQDKNSTVLDGSIECSVTYDNQYVTVLQANEFALASTDTNCNYLSSKSCKNYNYLADNYDKSWSITGATSSTYEAFKIYNMATDENTNYELKIYLVVNIPNDLLITKGNGSLENPYIIK